VLAPAILSHRRLGRSTAVVAAVILAASPLIAVPPSVALETRHRKPIAAALAADGHYLVIANRRSGTISLIDTAELKVVGEFPASDRLSALAAADDDRRFAAVDDKRSELILLRLVETEHAPRVEVVARFAVADDPVGVALSSDGRLAAVASRWSRKLQIIDVASDEVDSANRRREPRTTWPEIVPCLVAEFDLPFASREVLFFDDDARVVVSDAFGGGIAVFDLRRDELDGDDHRVTCYRIDGHAVRGLAFDPERREIVFAYQHLDQALPTTPEAIGEGRLLQNRLRRTATAEIPRAVRSTIDRPWPGRDIRLDRPGAAAADPQDLVLAADERVFVLLGGANQLAEFDFGSTPSMPRRAEVGSRPVSAAVDSARRFAYVADSLSDRMSVIDLGRMEFVASIALGPRPEPYPRDRGERLFFDARMSPGGGVSCHSCHVEGHTSGLLADTLADGTYGTPKRILTLQGTSLTDHWAWNGEFRELREQVRRSLETTMHVPPMRAADYDDIAAFLHTLPFPMPTQPEPSADRAADATQWQRGAAIFAERRCGRCHVGPLTYTSQPSFDVGLGDERGRTKFNPPSLRGVSQNARLFHDNRCESIEAVFRDEQHQLDTQLSEEDLAALSRFLRSL